MTTKLLALAVLVALLWLAKRPCPHCGSRLCDRLDEFWTVRYCFACRKFSDSFTIKNKEVG